MGSPNINYFIHAANILLLVSYSVRSILWLWLFAVAASLIAIPYYLLHQTVLWAPLAWSIVFVSINVFQSWRLLLERRPVRLTPDEDEVRKLAFRDLPPRKVLQIVNIGSWSTAVPGEQLIAHGKSVESISLLIKGKVQLAKEGRILAELRAGEIVGSALMLAGGGAEVDAVVTERVRAVRWDVRTLERYLNANPDIRNVFQQHLSRDLAGKLKRLGQDFYQTPSPRPHSPDGRHLFMSL